MSQSLSKLERSSITQRDALGWDIIGFQPHKIAESFQTTSFFQNIKELLMLVLHH